MSTLDHLERLIAFPTVSADSNLAIIEYIENHLSSLGFQCHRIMDETGLKAGLFASLGPDTAPGILLSGHTDVVPTTGQDWTVDPFTLTLQGGRAYGRGTTDMKGFLACMLSAAERASTLPLKEPLKLAFSYDEEIGCVGIRHLIPHLVPSIGLPMLCIVGEPTSMHVATGHKGKAALKAICEGTAGHSALAPKFTNAIHVASDFINQLKGLQDTLAKTGAQDAAYDIPYSTVHVGKIAGGVALNIVPDSCEVLFEYRHLTQDTPSMMMDHIRDAAQRVEALHPNAKITLKDLNTYPGLNTPANHDVVEFVRGLSDAKTLIKVPYGTEAGYFSETLDIPTVVCGPGSMEGQGHKADEYVELSELDRCDAMLTKLLQSMI